MKYDFDQVVERKDTNSLKWEFMHKFLKDSRGDTLPLWVADMDFPCAPQIIEALHKRVDKRIFGYSYQGTEKYYNAVTSWFRNRFQWEIDKDSIFYSPGVVPAIAFLLNALTVEGDGIIIQRPVYYPFTYRIEENNRRVVNNPLIYKDKSYTMDFVDLREKAAKKENKVMLLCSPHNPCGRVWNEAELKQLVEICKENGVWIISDEIHCDLTRKGVQHIPLEKIYPAYKEKIITCTAPSKSFNMAGLQMSNIIINNVQLRELWLAEIEGKCGMDLPNCFAITATEAAYEDCEDWLEQVCSYIDDNFAFVRDYLNTALPKAVMVNPQGTYLAWIDFREYEQDHIKLEKKILGEANVALDEGYIFGEEGRGFERINVACPRSILKECLEKITAVLQEEESK